jgi:phosphatidylglycerol:prolipoprotein diacylglycerol transferase
MVFHPESIAYLQRNYSPGIPLHPAQLYEIFLNLIFLIILILTYPDRWITKRRIAWYAIFYGLIRFIVEFFRSDSERFNWVPIFTTGQLISLSGFFVGLLLLLWTILFDHKLETSPPIKNILTADKNSNNSIDKDQ